MSENRQKRPIGVFDSGYGGLTVLRYLRERLPQYDFLYLGDNARAPYGSRSFDLIYKFTLSAVEHLIEQEGCPLVILACNTASAKALRSIQQNDLQSMGRGGERVLGVIRPTAETVASLTRNNHVGLFATPGTVASGSYEIEVAKQSDKIRLTSHPCPMWVPLVENGEASGQGADYFVRKECEALMKADPQIDTVVLACTHYPLLLPKIRQYLPPEVNIVAQGPLVADSLEDYLRRHPEIDSRLSRGGECRYTTTEMAADRFSELAGMFVGTTEPIHAQTVTLK